MTLKRKQVETDERSLGMVRLWRDDLTAMVDTIAEAAKDIQISTDLYELDSVEDLAKASEKSLSNFTLSANSGQIRLVLTQKSAKLTISSPDLHLRGMATEVERIAFRRRRPIRSHIQVVLFVLLGVFLVAAIFLGWQNPSWLAEEDGVIHSRTALEGAFSAGVLTLLFEFMLFEYGVRYSVFWGVDIYANPCRSARMECSQ